MRELFYFADHVLILYILGGFHLVPRHANLQLLIGLKLVSHDSQILQLLDGHTRNMQAITKLLETC